MSLADDNGKRASRAANALMHYEEVVSDSAEGAVSRLLTDLMHFCARDGIDFDARLKLARDNHAAERLASIDAPGDSSADS